MAKFSLVPIRIQIILALLHLNGAAAANNNLDVGLLMSRLSCSVASLFHC